MFFRFAIAVLLIATSASGLLATDSSEARFLKGLRERRLYRLAEIECRERLAESDLSDEERAEFVIQLALTYTAQALDATAAEREPHWANAGLVCEEHLQKYANSPRSLLVQLQRALVDVSRGEIEQLEAIGTPDEQARLARASEHLRAAIRRLESVRESVEDARNGLRPELLAKGGFDEHELESLAGNVALETARALRRQAACFPPDSPERDDALLRALAMLEPLAAKSPADDFVWRARLETVACLRQLGRVEPAQRQLDAWMADSPPNDLQDEIYAERLRLLLSAERTSEARQLASQPPEGARANADLARLEVFVAAWRAAPEEDLTAAINALLDRIRQQDGPATVRRAESLVGRAFASSPTASNPQSLIHAAEHLYHAGRVEEAIATYDRAAKAFAEQGDAEKSFEAALTAATIEKARGEMLAAARRYRQLALHQPEHPQAAVAHQAAILALADQLRANPSRSDDAALSQYGEMLAEHLAKWSNASTVDDVRWWQAQFLANRGQSAEALAALAILPGDSTHAAEGISLAGDLYEQAIAALPQDSTVSGDLLVQATRHLQPLVLKNDQRWPTEWTPLQRAAALELARLHLKYGPQGHDYAQRMLLAALRGAPVPEPEWQADAAPLLIVALVRGGQTRDALQWLQQTTGQKSSDALSLLDALLAELQSAPEARKSALAGVLLTAVDATAAAAKGDAEMQSLLVRYRAAALAGLNRDQEAIVLYNTLAPQRSRDGAVQEEYAQVLSRSDGTADREQGLQQWQRVERGSRQGSPRWFRARLARIQLLKELGHGEEAAKLLALTRLVHPDLGGEEMRGRFEAID